MNHKPIRILLSLIVVLLFGILVTLVVTRNNGRYAFSKTDADLIVDTRTGATYYVGKKEPVMLSAKVK